MDVRRPALLCVLAATFGADVRFLDELPSTLNPAYAVTAADRRVADLVFDRLVWLDDVTRAPRSDLLQADADGGLRTEFPVERTVQLFVKDGVTWHDGAPFTAADVCFTVATLLDPATASPVAAAYAHEIDHCTVAPDGRSFAITFRRALPRPLEHLGFHVLPAHAFPNGVARDLDFSARPFGTGPMAATRGRKGVAFTAWPNAHHAARIGAMSLEEAPADPFVATRLLVNGKADGLVEVAPALWTEVAENPALQASAAPDGFLFVAVNPNVAPFTDARIRRALDASLDRAALRELTVGDGPDAPELVTGPFLPSSPYLDPTIAPTAHDPARAERLLTEAGCVRKDGRWTFNGAPLVLKLGVNAAVDRQAADLSRQLGNQLTSAGFGVEVQRISQAEWAREAVTGRLGDYHLLVGAWHVTTPLDPVDALFHTRTDDQGTRNLFDFRDPETDRLLDAFGTARTDVEARDTYRALHARLVDQAPYLFLWTHDRRSAWSASIADLSLGRERYFGTFDQWHRP